MQIEVNLRKKIEMFNPSYPGVGRGGTFSPHRWFFDRCTQTTLAIGLKFDGFSSDFIPG